MPTVSFYSLSVEHTDLLGKLLAEHLPRRAVVSLQGTLGAGKTRLVQAVAVACGIAAEAVSSPTFVLCNEYRGKRTIYHLDAYRLHAPEEFLDLGVEEYFEEDALTFVEWGDRVREFLPEDRIEITLEVCGESARRFTLCSLGTLAPWADSLGKALPPASAGQ